MFSAISTGLASARAFATIAAVVAAATLIGVFWLQAHNAWKQVGALKIEKERLEQTVGALNIVLEGKNDAIEELEKTTQSLDRRNAELNSILGEIRNAAASENGQIAVVLARALCRIDAANGVRVKPQCAKRPIRHSRSPAKPKRMQKGAIMGRDRGAGA